MKAQKKILIVDAGKGVYNQLNEQQNLSVIHIQPDKDEKIYDIAKQIAGKLTEKLPEAIMINLEGGYENTSRSELKGTDLIYWLRLKYKYTGSIITYGFLAPEQILRLKPEYVVIHAPGNRHLQVPFDINELKGALKPANLEADKLLDIYRPYAEKLVNLHKARHERANWWAIKVMWDIDNIRKGEMEPYPDYVQEKLKELNNFLIILFYNKQISEKDIYKVIKIVLEDKKKEIERKLNKIKTKYYETWKEIENYGGKSDFKKLISKFLIVLEEYRFNLRNLLSEMQKFKFFIIEHDINLSDENFEEFEDEILQNKCKIKKLQKKFGFLTKKLKEKYTDINAYKSEILNELLKIDEINCNDLIEADNRREVKKKEVLIIDDLQKEWEKIYTKLFGYFLNFSSIGIKDIDKQFHSRDEKLKQLLRRIENQITTKELFIILDLRLLSDDEGKLGVTSSGFDVLRFLKQRFPQIPVLITTASNKIWTFKKAIREEADNFWIKEGFDNFFTPEDSIMNVIELENIVQSFSKKEYQVLRTIRYLRYIIEKSKKSFWWEKKRWDKVKYIAKSPLNPKKPFEPIPEYLQFTEIAKDDVINLLNEAEKVLELYLKNKFIFGYNTKEPYNEIINTLSKFIEMVHPFTHINRNGYSISNVINSRGDRIAKHLYQSFRHKTTHGFESVSVVELQHFLNQDKRHMDLFSYLTLTDLKTDERVEEWQDNLDKEYKKRH